MQEGKKERHSQQKEDAIFAAKMVASIICIIYLLLCAFPRRAHRGVTMPLCAFILAYCLISGIWGRVKRLRKSDMERNGLLLAMSTVYPIQIMVDLNDDLYEYLPDASFLTYDVPRSGIYSRLVSDGGERVLAEDREVYERFLSRDNLISIFSAGETNTRVEFRDLGKDGEYHWMVFHAYKIESKHDDKLRAILFARNNDEEKHKEAVLKEALEMKRRELSDVYSALRTGIVRAKKAEGFPVLSANDSFYGMIGYTKEQFDRECCSLLKNITFEADVGGYTEIPAGGRRSGRYRIVRRDGSIFWARYDIMLTPNEDNVCYIMYTDISDTVEAEQKLMRHRYYSELANKRSPGATIIFSATGQLTEPLYMRGDIKGMCGYSEEEVTRFSRKGFAGLLHRDDMEPMRRYIEHFTIFRPEEARIEFRINCKDGRTIWLVMVGSLIADYYGDDACICVLIDITAQKERELQDRIRSNTDQMTGVLNRNAFIEEIADAFKTTQANQKHAFIMLDIDDFKQINDCYGHSAGDVVLCSVSDILRGISRSDDIVGRIGGDEFMLMLRNVNDENALRQRCAEICRRISGLAVERMPVSASLGVTIYPTDARNFESIYMCADAAMYEAKRRGKNGYCIYASDM